MLARGDFDLNLLALPSITWNSVALFRSPALNAPHADTKTFPGVRKRQHTAGLLPARPRGLRVAAHWAMTLAICRHFERGRRRSGVRHQN